MNHLFNFVIALAVLTAISRCAPTPAYAHDTEIVGCDKNIKIAKVAFVKAYVNSNGTYSEEYDRNGDGQTDIEAVSHITGTDGGKTVHNEHPFLYFVDLDFDGQPDAVYVDKSGTGACGDIVLYRDLTVPYDADENGKEQGTAKYGQGLQDPKQRG